MKVGVLFVCLGNICRSPAAEGAFSHIVKTKNLSRFFHIDSCGTAGFHVGELPHHNTRSAAKKNGVLLVSKARQFQKSDFRYFDYILAMDKSNYNTLSQYASSEKERKCLNLFRSFDPDLRDTKDIPDVPDPYYGKITDFEEVQEIVWRTSEKILEQLVLENNLA